MFRTSLVPLVLSALPCLAQTSSGSEPPSPAQDEKSITRHLTPVENTVSSETATGFGGPYACDGDGNLYLRSEPAAGSIRKLNSKGERVALYQIRGNPDVEVDTAGSFSVTPDGELYMLTFSRKEPSRYVLIFQSDGTYKDKIKLQVDRVWFPSSLAVFPNGTLLVTGQRYDRDINAPKLPFTGIFSADGKLLKELKLEDDRFHDMPSPYDRTSSEAITWGKINPAKDGNLYLMRSLTPAVFYAISPSGEIVRRFTVDPGHPAYRALTVHITGNRIAVLFFDPQTMDTVLKIVSLEGEELASFEQPKEEGKLGALGLVFACYALQPERFTFLTTDEKQRIHLRLTEVR
jgi:hypothetical protein